MRQQFNSTVPVNFHRDFKALAMATGKGMAEIMIETVGKEIERAKDAKMIPDFDYESVINA